MRDFIHLSTHSIYSRCYSTATVEDIVDKAVSLGMPGVALTDKANMMGVMVFFQYCKKINAARHSNFKPIIGCELNLRQSESSDLMSQITVLAKNRTGYENLLKIMNNSCKDTCFHTAFTIPMMLEQHGQGLIVLAGNLEGGIQDGASQNRIEEAEEILQWCKQIWGDDFYLEILRHPAEQGWNQDIIEKEKQANAAILDLASKYGVKIVAANHCRFIEPSDAKAAEAFAKHTSGIMDKPRLSGQEWLKSQDEMLALFEDVPEAIDNTMEIFEKCEYYDICSEMAVPAFPLPEGFDSSEEYLRHLTFHKAQSIYGDILPSNVVERLEKELDRICSRGYADFFLIYEDLVRSARENCNLWVGPGRGSAPCSLVCYCLGITQIDPIAYNLPFERFMCSHNQYWPNIDLDVEKDGHKLLLKYLINKYGEDHVADVIAPTNLNDSTVRQLARDFDLTMEECAPLHHVLGRLGVHGCAIAMGKDKVGACVPIVVVSGRQISLYDCVQMENAGLTRLDVLDVKALTRLHTVVDLIRERKGEEIDVYAINLNDKQTLRAFEYGNTDEIPFFDASDIKRMLMYLLSINFETLVEVLSFCIFKNKGQDAYSFKKVSNKVIDSCSPISIIQARQQGDNSIDIFQEEIMDKMCSMADFSADDSDLVRKALCRDASEYLDSFKQNFMMGGLKNGYTLNELQDVWETWYQNRTHYFFKSHAVCYTLMAYWMMYLKVHYEEEFNEVMSAIDKK